MRTFSADPLMWGELRAVMGSSKGREQQLFDVLTCETVGDIETLDGGRTVARMVAITTTRVGSAVVRIVGNSIFGGFVQEFAIVRGRTEYLITASLQPKGQRSGLNSNKYLNQQDRTLHVQVRGRLANGSLVPVHFAGVYDQNGRHILTTDYNGNATARVREVMGETVTLKADGSHWQDGTASFIVGSSNGTRMTRNDDYVMIVLNSDNSNGEEEVTLDIKVRGLKGGKRVPVHFATIYDGNDRHLVTTNYYGNARVKVKAQLGEPYVVKADAGHWKPGKQTVYAGNAGGAGATTTITRVAFNLEPEATGKSLMVEVLDHDTNKPVPGANVTLYRPTSFPGTAVAHGTTNHNGETTFDAEQVDGAMLNGSARLGATSGGSEPSVQTLSSSLMNGELPRYVLYVKGKQEVTRWSGTWYGGPYVLQLAGGNGSLGYTFKRCEPKGICHNFLDEGGGNCTISANVATCQQHGHYKDVDKDIINTGPQVMVLSRGSTPAEDTISSKFTVLTGSIKLTAGTCPDIAQCTGLHPGATFTATYSRKQP